VLEMDDGRTHAFELALCAGVDFAHEGGLSVSRQLDRADHSPTRRPSSSKGASRFSVLSRTHKSWTIPGW
jgi:hypothetical protein